MHERTASLTHADALPLELDSAIDAVLREHPTLPLPGRGQTLERWRRLAQVSGEDLCLAKVVEAHWDADAICADLGATRPAAGERWAVWAAESRDAPLRFIPGSANGPGHLDGVKLWCSGARLVTHALLTAVMGDAPVLARVRLADAGITAREDGWNAVGMARVHSGPVQFDNAPAVLVGGAGAYLARPGFWHGGAGIAACWHGGAAAVAQALQASPRVASDPHAAAHLGAVDYRLAANAALLRELGALIDAAPGEAHIAAVQRVRSHAERTATEVLDRVGRALGAGPLCLDGRHAQRAADLSVFIRQSHAERDWAAAAQGVTADTWRL